MVTSLMLCRSALADQQLAGVAMEGMCSVLQSAQRHLNPAAASGCAAAKAKTSDTSLLGRTGAACSQHSGQLGNAGTTGCLSGAQDSEGLTALAESE